MKYKMERMCRCDSISAVPMERQRFDLKASEKSLKAAGYEVGYQELFLTLMVDGMDLTIYSSGRILFHPAKDKVKAKELALKLFDLLVKEGD